jgi:peptidoglycan/LPS O-acetylase OafA/YrhL
LVTALRFGPLRYLGTIAYGVYLIHPTVLILARGLILENTSFQNGFPAVIVTGIAFMVTLLLAAVSWHFFEKPIIRRSHLFSYTNKNVPATA